MQFQADILCIPGASCCLSMLISPGYSFGAGRPAVLGRTSASWPQDQPYFLFGRGSNLKCKILLLQKAVKRVLPPLPPLKMCLIGSSKAHFKKSSKVMPWGCIAGTWLRPSRHCSHVRKQKRSASTSPLCIRF